MNKPIYSFKNIKFSENKNLLLDIRKFDIHRGSCYMFYGDMGSGKTLILDVLTKKNNKYRGELLYDSNDLSKISKNIYYKDIAIVSQYSKKHKMSFIALDKHFNSSDMVKDTLYLKLGAIRKLTRILASDIN